MSTLLESRGIEIFDGYDARNIADSVDVCVIGNAMTRGNAEVEHILDSGLTFESGPEWLRRHALAERYVIAVAGTHGKTTTTSMICHALDSAGHECGFLVGGVPGNFDVSARLGKSSWFVIEADEYDTAFFDKRSKFVHYLPRIAVLNNLEFDHGDIFRDIEDIKTQVHHLVRTIPRHGTIVVNDDDENLTDTLSRGCWSRIVRFSPRHGNPGNIWRIGAYNTDFSAFDIVSPGGEKLRVEWRLFGAHNASNAVAATAALSAAGIPIESIAESFKTFVLPKRRLQLVANVQSVHVYEDFAHHPTAIAQTLEALATRHPGGRLVVALEPRSNTMRSGVHNKALAEVLSDADICFVLTSPELPWNPSELTNARGRRPCESIDEVGTLVERVTKAVRPGDTVVLMSNGGFGGAPAMLAEALTIREPGRESTVH
jgi:UDP-N-acetylmuramate: L-alanyl-gamma-D-glutamyl-meso-diaminopimelate ligase